MAWLVGASRRVSLPALADGAGIRGIMAQPHILVVEDSPDERALVDEAFAATGRSLDVELVGSAGEALALLERPGTGHWPRLLVTDRNLPDLDGCELILRLRRQPASAGTRMVLLSGDVARPPAPADVIWYGKPDTWPAWRCWAAEMADHYLASDGR